MSPRSTKSSPARSSAKTSSASTSPAAAKKSTRNAAVVGKKPVKQIVDGRLAKPASKSTRPPRSVKPREFDEDAPRKRVVRPRTPGSATALSQPPAKTTRKKAPTATALAVAADGLPKRKRAQTQAQAEVLRKAVLDALEEMKARDLVALDVREKTSITDWFIIVTGTSSRHVKSLAEEVVKAAKALNLPPLGVEGEGEGEWIVVDLADVVVHVMQPRAREFYALEKLWGVGEPALVSPLA